MSKTPGLQLDLMVASRNFMPKHVLVIYNPTAKSQVPTEVWMGKIVEELNKNGEYLVSFFPTTAQTKPETLVPLIGPPLTLVIAAGGDGTVRFTLGALAKAKSKIPAAIFPLGTGNVLARNLGIVDEALFADPLLHVYDYITNGKPMYMDMAMMNGEYFAGMAGVGPISDAFMTPARDDKTNFKLLAYIKALLSTIAMPPRIFKISTAGVSFKVQASGVFISNVEDLGIGKQVDINLLKDGFLDLHVVNPMNFKDYVNLGFRYAGGSAGGDVPDYSMRVKEAVVEVIPRFGSRSSFQDFGRKILAFITGKVMEFKRTDELPCMIDGDAHGNTPLRVCVLPNAVRILVPSKEYLKLETENQNALPPVRLPSSAEARRRAVGE